MQCKDSGKQTRGSTKALVQMNVLKDRMLIVKGMEQANTPSPNWGYTKPG